MIVPEDSPAISMVQDQGSGSHKGNPMLETRSWLSPTPTPHAPLQFFFSPGGARGSGAISLPGAALVWGRGSVINVKLFLLPSNEVCLGVYSEEL